MTSTSVQQLGSAALAVLFGLAAILGLAEKLRGRPHRATATYGSAVAAILAVAYLLTALGA